MTVELTRGANSFNPQFVAPAARVNDLIINRGGRKRTRVNCVCFTNLSPKRRPPLMKFYCGIDLSARDCQHLGVVIE